MSGVLQRVTRCGCVSGNYEGDAIRLGAAFCGWAAGGGEDTRDIIVIISRLFSTFSKRAYLPTTRKPSAPYKLLQYCLTVGRAQGRINTHTHTMRMGEPPKTYIIVVKIEENFEFWRRRTYISAVTYVYIYIRYLTNIIQGVPRTHYPLRYLPRHR